MTIDASFIFGLLITILMGVIAWTVNAQKKVIENVIAGLRCDVEKLRNDLFIEIEKLRNKFELEVKEIRGQLSEMMTIGRCKDNHEALEKAHDKDIALVKKDVDGIGSQMREVSETVKEVSECMDTLVTK